MGTAAAEHGYRVKYTLASKLVNELAEAADDRQLSRTIARYGRVDLLLLDELGYLELDRRGAELLFEVLTEREEKSSIAIASNEAFCGWTKTFTDPRLCAAIVDRLTFNGHIIETGTTSPTASPTPEPDVRPRRRTCRDSGSKTPACPRHDASRSTPSTSEPGPNQGVTPGPSRVDTTTPLKVLRRDTSLRFTGWSVKDLRPLRGRPPADPDPHPHEARTQPAEQPKATETRALTRPRSFRNDNL